MLDVRWGRGGMCSDPNAAVHGIDSSRGPHKMSLMQDHPSRCRQSAASMRLGAHLPAATRSTFPTQAWVRDQQPLALLRACEERPHLIEFRSREAQSRIWSQE